MKVSAVFAVLSLSTLLTSCFTTGCQEKTAEIEAAITEAMPQAPESTDSEFTFYVNINLFTYVDEVEAYPLAWEQFKAALETWVDNVPVRWSVLVLDGDIMTPFFVERGGIYVQLANIQELGFPEDLLGAWQPGISRLVLDADYLEWHPEAAYAVALHELGHLLGVPHIVNYEEFGASGYLVVPSREEARSYVMYPRSVPEFSQDKLSPLEIQIARNSLNNWWLVHDLQKKESNCLLDTE